MGEMSVDSMVGSGGCSQGLLGCLGMSASYCVRDANVMIGACSEVEFE